MSRVTIQAGRGRNVLAGASSAAVDALWAGAVLAGAAVALDRSLALGSRYVGAALAAYVAGAAAVVMLAGRHVPRQPFGAANRITLLRGALIALVLGFVAADAAGGTAAVLWTAIALAAAALLLDGVDGALARRRGTAGPFGARFDMETDALAILALAALAWRFDRAGAWVLASGLLRYAFVAAGRALPALRAPLPPSRRRQTVCVVQIVTLLACLAPVLPPALARLAAAAGLAALAASFAVDTVWLLKRPGGGRSLGRLPQDDMPSGA